MWVRLPPDAPNQMEGETMVVMSRPTFRIVCYKDKSGEWRWSMYARNGKIIADSAESYKRRRSCVRMAAKIADGGGVVEVQE